MKKTVKGILPSTNKMILKTHYPLPARQAPVYPQQQNISSCSPSPMSCTKPEPLGDDQTESSSFGAQADGRKEEHLETSFEVRLNDMPGKHRDGERNPLESPQVSEKRTRWLWVTLRTQIGEKKTFFKPRLGWTSKQHKSPLAIP